MPMVWKRVQYNKFNPNTSKSRNTTHNMAPGPMPNKDEHAKRKLTNNMEENIEI